jgi:hypothetical protein
MMTAATASKQLVSKHDFVDVMQNILSGQKSLHATVGFNTRDVICLFSAGLILDQPTYLTVQTGEHTHITLQPEFLQYTNHSCEPNVFFDTSTMQLIALTAIQPGDELVYFYPSTEWDMKQPFDCLCGSHKCLHKIKGAAYLSDVVAQQYRLTDFIQRKINNKK